MAGEVGTVFVGSSEERRIECRCKTVHPLTKHEKDAYDKIQDVSALAQQCYNALNYFLTDSNRKRRYAVCATLGAAFSTFAGMKQPRNDDSEFLFDDDVTKKMKKELLKLPVSGSSRFSKNGSSFKKTNRSSHNGNYDYQYNNQYQYNNNNNNNYNGPRNRNNSNNNHNNNNPGRNNRGGPNNRRNYRGYRR